MGRSDNEEEEQEEQEIEDLLYSLLTRKEVSVGWKDTSIPHLLGYGSILYVVEQLLMYPSDLLKTRLQVDLRPDSNLSKVRKWNSSLRLVASPVCPVAKQAYDLTWQIARQDWWVLCKHIYKHEGWLGFFRGFGEQDSMRVCVSTDTEELQARQSRRLK